MPFYGCAAWETFHSVLFPSFSCWFFWGSFGAAWKTFAEEVWFFSVVFGLYSGFSAALVGSFLGGASSTSMDLVENALKKLLLFAQFEPVFAFPSMNLGNANALRV